MIDDEQYLKLYANCITVKGKKRSAICDLQRKEIKLIPNDLHNLLVNYEKEKIGEIKKKFNNQFDETIDEYFIFLISNELGFITDQPELFPKLSNDWFEPALISNAILDISEKNNYNILNALNQIDEFNCKNIELRFFKKIEISELKIIINHLNINEMFITSVDFIFPFIDEDNIIDIYTDLIQNNKRINSITNYNCKEHKFVKSINEFNRGTIFFTKKNINSEKHCGLIDAQFFSINIKNFTESQHHNSCLNRKISIDVNGDIKNCPSMLQGFGNIKDTTLKEALNHKDFKKYWNITKNQIEVCKDCEFRYICTDCRAYVEKPNNDNSKPLKCGYDPYTNQWEEWSTNPLKKKTIEYYEMQELVKKNY